MNIRLANDDDCRWYYELAMLPDTRAASVRSDAFTYSDHKAWWARRAHEPSTRIYIGEELSTRVGAVRFGRVPGAARAEIAIMVEPGHRRRGYALELLRAGETLAAADLGVSSFVALVLLSNDASAALFTKAGYRLRSWEERMGKQCRRLEK